MILVTGAAGFIGYHTCKKLLSMNEKIIGIDNLNDYYDIKLKHSRLNELKNHGNFEFQLLDISDKESLEYLMSSRNIDRVIHLAAQAGVRYSLENPSAYIQSNIVGHFNILESCNKINDFKHLVYASSSSVYGGNIKLPYSINDMTDNPVSLYAATKKSNELISHSYNSIYNLPQTGLRFFTVYGPLGRPDMAYYKFTKSIIEGEEIEVFNNGNMKRDFTYIDDVVSGIISALKKYPADHQIYNLGNNKSENLMDFINVIERAIGKKARIKFLPMQLGDVKETYADIKESKKDLSFSPKISIIDGIPKFVNWYRKYYGV